MKRSVQRKDRTQPSTAPAPVIQVYTHIDRNGMLWRFDGSRPVSELADRTMRHVSSIVDAHDSELAPKVKIKPLTLRRTRHTQG